MLRQYPPQRDRSVHSDLYDTSCGERFEAKGAVERALACGLQEHESLYQGGDYYGADLINGEIIVVKCDIDPFDGTSVESNFPNVPSLVYVSDISRSSEIRSAFRKQKPISKLLYK